MPRAVMLLVSSRALKVLSPICMLFVFGFGLRKGGVAASGAGGFAVDDEDGADGSARGGGLCGWWPLRVEVSTKMSSFWQAVLKALAALLPNSFFDFLQ